MSTVPQIPIRAEFDITSSPPVVPINANTGGQIRFYRAQNVGFAVGVFDQNNVAVDLANLVALSLIIQEAPTSLVPLINETVGSSAITPTITRAGWLDGSEQQALFSLTAAETDVGLDGGDSKQFWFILRGVTAAGDILNYGGGYIEIFNPGNQLPTPMPGVVYLHTQTNSSGNSIVNPGALINSEIITIEGGAGIRNIIVNPAGLTAGCLVRLSFNFPSPAVAGIELKVWNGSLSGELLLDYTTDDTQPNALMELVADGLGGFSQAQLVSPAFFP